MSSHHFQDSVLLATSLGDIDSVRLIKVDPFRSPDTAPLTLRDNYTSWLKAGPDVSFVNEKPETIPNISKPEKYKFTKHMRPLGSLFIPIPSYGGFEFIYNAIQTSDPQKFIPPNLTQKLSWLSTICLGFFGISIYPHAVQRIYSANNEGTLKKTIQIMAFMPIITTLFMVVVGLTALALFPGLDRQGSEGATVLVAFLFSVPYLGVQLKASGSLFNVLSDGLISVNLGMFALTTVVVIYVASGGLKSVAYVDCAQAVLLGLLFKV